jgi:SagB-type dehydrogenase family enzyme
MMQDMGALLGGMEQIAYSLNWDTAALHWFNDRHMGELLGLDTQHEAPFVVLGACASNRVAARAEHPTRTWSAGSEDTLPAVDFVHLERSKCAQPLRHLLEIHATTCLTEAQVPVSMGQKTPGFACQAMASGIVGTNLTAALLTRETPWGQITDRQPVLGAQQLLAAVSFAFGGLACATDPPVSSQGLPLLRLEAVIRRVDGLSRGLWRYDEATCRLMPKGADAPAQVLRRIYTARFHNLDLVPAVLVLVGKLGDAVARFGQRGIRIMNCEAGVFAQRAYLACAALSLGCGAVLGFNRTNLGDALRLDSATEVPLLMIFVGPRRPRTLAFDFRLV